jgi:hypothetical protein
MLQDNFDADVQHNNNNNNSSVKLRTFPRHFQCRALKNASPSTTKLCVCAAADCPEELRRADCAFSSTKPGPPPKVYVSLSSTQEYLSNLPKEDGGDTRFSPKTVRIADGSVLTYVWLRFVDQPALQYHLRNWGDFEKMLLQSKVEGLSPNPSLFLNPKPLA